ncbi:MAG: TolB family protein [Acidobacteriaceae bacterium]
MAAAVILIVAYILRPIFPLPQVTGVTQLTHDDAVKLFGLGPPPSPLLTDGSRIYFVEEPTNHRLMQVSTEGGEVIPAEISIPFYGLLDISPTRLELLFKGPPKAVVTVVTRGQNEGLWALPVPGGQPRRIGNMLVNDATFTPDGNAIFYSVGHDIFKANDDGSQPRKILSIAAGLPFWLRISPDGSFLRFSVYNWTLRASSLWEAHADGSHLRQLLLGWENPANECCGNWTSDGKYFIFQATRYGLTHLWATRERGDWWRKVNHAPVQLTMGEMNSQSPLPNKNGTKVFFIGSTRKDEIIRYEPSTHSFLPYLSGLSAEGLTFTADGKKMAYVSYSEGVLWESNTDGSGRHELSFPPMEVGLPRWSPDGTKIAFSGREPGGTWQIFVVSAEGGDLRQVTSGPVGNSDGSWSPDGNLIAFAETFANSTISARNPLHILNLETHQVTDVPGSVGLFSPRWSPDGRYLVAITDDFQKLMLYDFAAHKWEVLANVGAAYPNWSHDGKCVYFNGGDFKTLPIYRVCLVDRKLEHIVDLSSVAGRLAFGRFGWWTGLGPNNSILAARDIGTQEIYALDTKFP